jgi:hypothetical protein
MKFRLICCAAAIAAMGSIGLAAQTEVKQKTKTEVSGGKEITTTGCIDRLADGRYVLTSVGGDPQYVLVGNDDVSKHVGQRVQVKGKATDLGHTTVKTETTTRVEGEHGKDQESHETVKTEGRNPTASPMLGVQSLKQLASSCS